MNTIMDDALVENELRARGLWNEMTAIPGNVGLIIVGEREFFYRQHGFDDDDRNFLVWMRCDPGNEKLLSARIEDLRDQMGLCFEKAPSTDYN